MKKIILTAIAFIGITATAQVKVGSDVQTLATNANFQVEGTTAAEQFVVLKNGNVGIGMTFPAKKLDVIGLGRFDYQEPTISSASWALSIKATYALDIDASNYGPSNGANPAVKIKKNSTSTNARFAHLSLSDATTTGGLSMWVNSNSRIAQISSYDYTGNSYTNTVLALNSLGGNVGINTTAPTQTLDVRGSIRMVDGNQATGKVMVSAADGTGSWGTVSGLPVVNSTPAAVAAAGDVYVDPNGGGLIIKDTAGTKWRITVSTSGVLTTTATSN